MPLVTSAIIFDLDGVLADSEPWWNQIDAKLLSEHGVNYRGECHQDVLGVSYRIAIDFYKKTFGIDAPAEQMMKRRGEIAAEFFADRVGLFPGTRRVLEDLAEQKLLLAVATSSVGTSARPFLDRHQLTQFFDVIVTGDEVERGKPAPDIYLRAAEKLRLRAEECLVIEDALCRHRRRQGRKHARRRNSRRSFCESSFLRRKSRLDPSESARIASTGPHANS